MPKLISNCASAKVIGKNKLTKLLEAVFVECFETVNVENAAKPRFVRFCCSAGKRAVDLIDEPIEKAGVEKFCECVAIRYRLDGVQWLSNRFGAGPDLARCEPLLESALVNVAKLVAK